MNSSEKYAWQRMPRLARALIFLVAYAAAAELGHALSVGSALSTFWPPAGVAFALLALSSPKEWPLLLAALAVANTSSDLFHGKALLVSLGFTVAKGLEAAVGAFLVQHCVGFPARLVRRGDVARFGALAVIVAPAVGATIGTVVARAGAGGTSAVREWLTWWSGDALSTLVVGALALVVSDYLARHSRGLAVWPSPSRTLGYFGLLILTCAGGIAGVAYLGPLAGWKFSIFLPAAVIAGVYGVLGTTTASFSLAIAMSAMLALGPHATAASPGALSADIIVMQGFLAIMAFTSLFLAVSVDESRSTAIEARALAGKYRILLETLPIGVTISDESGAILETSAQAQSILGLPTRELQGREIQGQEWGILRPDGTRKPEDEWVPVVALRDGHSVRAQEGIERADGSRVWLDVTATPIPVEGYGVAITYSDITSEVETRERLRQSEARLTALTENLEDLVLIRTAEVERVNQELRDALAVKDQFLQKMSHELRTPLNSIIGFSDVMRRGLAGPLNDEQHKQLGMIHASGQHLLELVSDVLDLSQIDQRAAAIVPGTMDVRACVATVVASVRRAAEARGVRLVTELPEQSVEIISDETMLSQILANLVGNAVKFTDEGSVTISVDDSHPRMVSIAVADTGRGIPECEITRVMEQFHQVRSDDGMPPDGTGLGLTIAARLAHLLGGRIDVESSLGVGSTFTVVLPRTLVVSEMA